MNGLTKEDKIIEEICERKLSIYTEKDERKQTEMV